MDSFPVRSPWLHQLNRKRPAVPLSGDSTADVAVIGAGIAGVATAYHVLRDTDQTVLLLDADRVAHGATGHNAGQLVACFERSLASMSRQWGLEVAAQGWRDIEGAWGLLETMRNDLAMAAPLYRTTGYEGFSDVAQVHNVLQENALREEAGLEPWVVILAEEYRPGVLISVHHEHLVKWAPQDDILGLLETNDRRYIGLLADARRGCMNSALFCEEAVRIMLERYAARIQVAEMTPISRIDLTATGATLVAGQHTVSARRVVLCTNGFEDLHITNGHGPDIDARFHHDISGNVGYMAAFTEPQDHPPATNAYLDRPGIDPEQPYFYTTRRPYEIPDSTEPLNLVSVGGPERTLLQDERYDRTWPFPAHIHNELEGFLRSTYRYFRPGRTEDTFFWHGLMGYTVSRVRLIGPEPCNPVLMYNLGCNGVGLLPSIHGGWRIAQQVAGTSFGPSVFDPQDKTCPIR